MRAGAAKLEAMIVRQDGDRHLLIPQPDHAALARLMMEAWGGELQGSPRRDSILHAVAAHDDGWLPVDQAPVVDAAGALLDFVAVSVETRHGVWPRSVERLAGDPWAAALVAEHAVTVFERFRGDTAWTTFFATMEALRDEHRRAAGGTREALAADYFFLRAGDLLSLTFCNGWTEPQHWGTYTMQLEGERLWVSPDPFDGREVLLAVTARVLPIRTWTEAEAREAYTLAPRVTLAGVLAGR